jgi:proline iminopeptidase
LRDALTPLSSSHTLVFYDPRHRGRSDASADTTLSTFDGDVDDMEAVRRQLGISRVSIIGFSYFGAVAAAYAERYPDRVGHLVLLSPIEPTDSLERAYDPPERRTRVDTTRARALLKLRAIGRDTSDPVSYCLAYWQVNAPLFVGDLAHAARLNPTWCQLPNEAPRSMGDHVARTMRSLGTRRDFSPRASHLTVPTLIVNGEQDLVASPAGAAAWARLISRARQVAVPGAGHFVFLEERDAVVRAIDRFLRDLAPS